MHPWQTPAVNLYLAEQSLSQAAGADLGAGTAANKIAGPLKVPLPGFRLKKQGEAVDASDRPPNPYSATGNALAVAVQTDGQKKFAMDKMRRENG